MKEYRIEGQAPMRPHVLEGNATFWINERYHIQYSNFTSSHLTLPLDGPRR